MSELTLVKILKEVLDVEGGEVKIAKRDLKTIKNNRLGVKTFRALIAGQIKALKVELQTLNRAGGGKKAGEVQRTINYLRSVLNELTEELALIRLQVSQCSAYIKQKSERVRTVDAEWEKAKADEAAQTEQA